MWFKKKIDPSKIKRKITKELQSQGIKVIDHLPHLENPNFKNSKEVAKRMMVLLALFQLHLEAPKEIIANWIASNDLTDCLTDNEIRFLKTDYKHLSKQDQIDIYWYIEAIWALAWVGGFHNTLSLNSAVEDSLSSMLPKIANNDSSKNFISTFKIRSQFEIFEMLDRFYRAHWFVRNNKLIGIKSDKVDMDLIMERRKVLEYVCYKNSDWDTISLDT